MFVVKILGLLVALLSIFVNQNDAASCSSYGQDTCQQSSVCAWINSVCTCNASQPLEVVFVMDSSGSVTSSGWTTEKNFVIDMIKTGLSSVSSVGVVEFATLTTTAATFDTTQSTVSTIVSKLSYMNKDTYTLDGMNAAYQVFAKTTKGKDRMIMLITDGSPNPPDTQNPCNPTLSAAKTLRSNLAAYNITTILVTVGPQVKASTLGCLYNYDNSRVISASAFNNSAFQSIRSKTDAYLCPTNSDFRIAEVRAQVSASGDDGGNARFLELYNNGDIFDFSTNAMVLSGYVYGTINTGTIGKGKRLVIYQISTASDMQCNSCTCSGLSGGRCANAVYIGCGSGGSSCSFNTTMSNSFWHQKVTDTVDKTTWIDVKHDSSVTANNLATVYQGFTFEVVDVLGDTSSGRNWKRSCTKWGTPGDKPLNVCTTACVNEICQASGDTGSSCSSNKCSCTTSNNYYSTGLQCLSLPAPTNCITQVIKDSSGNQYGQVVWDDVGVALSHYFEVTYTYNSFTTVDTSDGSGITNIVYGGSSLMVTGHTVPTVKTMISANGQTVSSTTVSCPYQTPAPSEAPTHSPTLKPTKKPTIAPSKPPTKKPTKPPTKPPTKQPTTLPTHKPTSYPTVSGYQINSCTINVARGTQSATVTFSLHKSTTVSDTSLDLSLQLNADGDTSLDGAYEITTTTSPQTLSVTTDFTSHTYWLWARYKDRVGGSYTGYNNGHACTIVTQQPTKAPTGQPTPSPTDKPTQSPVRHPTHVPTQKPTHRPTYANLEVTNCEVTLGRFVGSTITSFDITFTEPTLDSSTLSSSEVLYDIEWASSSTQVGSAGSEATQTVPISDIVISWSDTVTITPVDSNNNAVGGTTTCTKKSHAPTRHPTAVPIAPTQSPVTPSIGLNVDSCSPGTVDDAGNTIYACDFKVLSQGAYTIEVDLFTASTSVDLDFTWSITYDSQEPKLTLGSDMAIATDDDFKGVTSGTGTIQANDNSGGFSLYVVKKSNADVASEIAWLELDSCTFGSLTCNVASSRRVFRIQIKAGGNEKKTLSHSKGKMPVWVWYPIAAGILLLAGLAAFGYMYYNKRKLAEEQLQQREADLANAEELDNLENFGGLGDNINFNPIATAGTQDVATGGEYIDKQLAKQQKHAEFAQVDVDKEVWRQDFGQVKADRHTEV